MNIQEYIQSGIIESYVLGLASTEEINEIDRLRKEHLEVEKAIDYFSILLENEAIQNAIPPPPEVKEKILAIIQKDKLPGQVFAIEADDDRHSIATRVKNLRMWRFVAAASIIFFIISASLNLYWYSEYSQSQEAYQALLSERETLQANNQVYQTQLKEWQSAAAMIADTGMAMVKMRSTQGNDEAATVFWDIKSKDVFVMVNKLPEPKTGKQYQLWALVDGKPVDAGVLDPSCTSVCKMKNIPKDQAFAITLEKEGGNPTPNLKALHVMGNI